ncbi:MAG: potassium-transporting ATPase subunit KdpA [Alphaproteobacteria bacterium]|nr:potassium-transporting ATPase subunit KdpA [Alphaproteobacteria bacterium]
MLLANTLTLLATLAATIALAWPLSLYLQRVFAPFTPPPPNGSHHPTAAWWAKVTYLPRRVEGGLYRMAGIDPGREHSWLTYLVGVVLFNLVGLIWLTILLHYQNLWPLNPAQLPAVPWPLAINIAASFMTNTNWQAYAGEVVLSPFSQTVGLAVQNFLAPASAIAIALALTRSFARSNMTTLGNCWRDMIRAILYVLLPMALLLALILLALGVPQNFNPPMVAQGLEGAQQLLPPALNGGSQILPPALNGGSQILPPALNGGSQILPHGAMASQTAIMLLGSNGGGFLAANQAHPYLNPSLLTNWVQMGSMLLLPMAVLLLFGRLIGQPRQGWMLLLVALSLLLLACLLVGWWEQGATAGRDLRLQAGGAASWWSVVSAASGNGSTNMAIGWLNPLSQMVLGLLIMVGGVTPGGVGCGLYGLLLYALLTIFITGLMVGRTPEIFGKKIEVGEMRLVMLAILIAPAAILLGQVAALLSPQVLGDLHQGDPTNLSFRFSQLLFAFGSAAGNNGGSLGWNYDGTHYADGLITVVMLVGRLAMFWPIAALAGRLAAKKSVTANPGTLATDRPLFAMLLAIMIVLLGGLTYMPSMMMGSIADYLLP